MGASTHLWLIRLGVLAGVIGIIEGLCRFGVIDAFTMQAPSKMAIDVWQLLASGKYNAAIAKTLGNAAVALALSLSIGIFAAVLIHRVSLLREALEPLFATYYAIPVLAFYPLLIILFGVGDAPKIAIAFMLSVIAVIVNTLNGLDRVPRVLGKTARIMRMSPREAALRVTLPYAAPYVLTGAKFAVAYSLIEIIGSEFIMSSNGIGFEIAFAYNNFENAVMYPLIVLILAVSIGLNLILSWWEQVILRRRGLNERAQPRGWRGPLLLIVGLIVGWQGLYMLAGDMALRSPLQTINLTWQLVTQPQHRPHIEETMQAFVLAVFFAISIGLATGLVFGFSKFAGDIFEPILVALYSIPN